MSASMILLFVLSNALAISIGAEISGPEQLINMLNAAIIRVQETAEYDKILEETADDLTPPNVDVSTFFKQNDSSVDSMPYPVASELTGIAKDVIDTGLMYTCEFAPFTPNASANRETVLFEAYLRQISVHYGTDVKAKYVLLDPTSGDHFESLVKGRAQGGCDVDIAGAAVGGFWRNKPRTTGPLGQFLATIPTQGQGFNVQVADSCPYKTWSAIKQNAAQLTVCISFVNNLIAETYFRAGTIQRQFVPNEEPLCQAMVLNSSNTIYLTGRLTIGSPATAGLTNVYVGIVAPASLYVSPGVSAEVLPLAETR